MNMNLSFIESGALRLRRGRESAEAVEQQREQRREQREISDLSGINRLSANPADLNCPPAPHTHPLSIPACVLTPQQASFFSRENLQHVKR